MRLKIEDLKNPVVEVAPDGFIPDFGALIQISFEPNPRMIVSMCDAEALIFMPLQEKAGVKFLNISEKEIYLSTLPEWMAWRLITTLIAVEYYLADKINYRPQIVSHILRALNPSR